MPYTTTKTFLENLKSFVYTREWQRQ